MRIKTIIAITIASLSILAYQQCAKVELEQPILVEKVEAPSLQIKASYCPDSRTLPAESAKYMFVIDMSSSNIGDWDTDPKVGNQTPLSYWDPTKATDFNGDRFAAVRTFLATCGNQANAQFAVIGFSYTAGIITGTGATRALSCTNVQFTNAATALTHLNGLAQAQETEKPWFLQWSRSTGRYLTDPNSPPILGPTSYRSAMTCTQTVVVNDLIQPGVNTTDRYHVFFVSDGVPVDKKETTGCNQPGWTDQQKSTCQMNAVVDSTSYMRQAAFAKGKDLRVHSIYYGRSSIPVHMDTIAKEGGTAAVMKLDSFSQDQNILCSLIIGQLSVELRPDSLAAINMTALRKNGVLQADSDMDGLTDDEELALGFDPANPRSAVDGVLDGICVRLGGLVACQDKRRNTVCQPGLLNKAGLTDCDVRMLGLQNLKSTPDWGLDSDGDGLLDFVEIVKGSDPAVADLAWDPDGDGVITRREVEQGTDPFVADQDIPSYQLNNSKVSYSPLGDNLSCSYGRWEAQVSRLQTTATLDVRRMPTGFEAFNHDINEHVILFSYRLTPQNSNLPTSEFFWSQTKVLVNPDLKASTIESVSKEQLSKDDFVRLGEVQL